LRGTNGSESIYHIPKHKKAIVCSLTHLEITGNTLLAEEMRRYQEKRKKKLTQQAGFGLQDLIIKR
jgi:hypothetical protein